MYRVYPIRIRIGKEEKVYSTEFQTHENYSNAWRNVLLNAYGKADIKCLCPGFGEKKIAIKYLSLSDKFCLARYPQTGSQHYIDCIFYESDSEQSGIGEYSKEVIKETPGGFMRVRMDAILSTTPRTPVSRTIKPQDDTSSPESEPDAVKRPSRMTLTGLLHFLWTKARLNCWTPGMDGKRNIDSVHYWLDEVSEKIITGRFRLFDMLLIATSGGNKKHIYENIKKVQDAFKRKHRLIVIAPLASFNPERKSRNILPVAYFHGIPVIQIGEDFWDEKTRHFKDEILAWQKGNRIIAIVLADTDGKNLFAVNAAFMRITPRWIPVESDFEAMVEEKLYRELRLFEKPLKYDAVKKKFPSFRLYDVEGYYPLRILTPGTSNSSKNGDRTPRESGWVWDVSASPDSIPDFPPKTLKIKESNS